MGAHAQSLAMSTGDAPEIHRLWPPSGSLRKRWRGSRDLEKRRRDWTRRFFSADVAASQDVVAACERGIDPPPAALDVRPRDDAHATTLAEIRGDWRAVKVCARRLPSDPFEVALEVLEGAERRSAALLEQVDHARGIANDRAPNGGRWFEWAMTHPEFGMDPADAARRDMASGGMETYVDVVDEGIRDFRRALRKARFLSVAAHLIPLAALAGVVALGEGVLSLESWWLVLIVGITAFLLVDWLFITHIVEPLFESWRREILDDVADRVDWLGLGALAAALSRESFPDPGQ